MHMYTVLNLRVAFWTGNVNKCQQMPACVGVRTAYSAYDYRNTLLNRQAYAKMSIYVTDTPDIL